MRKIIDLIITIAIRLIRFLIRRPLNFIKRHFRGVIMTYIAGVLLGTPLVTSLTTQAKITEPLSIVEAVKDGGIPNALTWGALEPVKNGVQVGIGEVKEQIGEWTNNQDLIESGMNAINEGKSWFEHGSDKHVAEVSDYELDENFTYEKYPNYYKSLGLADVDTSQFPEKGTYEYSNLDNLDRTGTAKATITYEDTNTGCREVHGKDAKECERQQFGASEDPSGWVDNRKVSIPGANGKSYNGYFYNRSHLIGDAIGGDAIQENAITGTRNQNVGNTDNNGGMRYTEQMVEDYFSQPTDEVVYYEVTPVYNGDEIVPRYVIVNVMSSDKKLNETVQVFNNANGWTIDYTTGQFQPVQ